MSHLGDDLSAFLDGELTGAELDRASAHLAACGKCRGDAAALRALKSELRALAANGGDDDLTRRLLDMEDPSAAADARPLSGLRSVLSSPYDFQRFEFPTSRSSRRRSLVWGAVSLAVVGGVGAAAFGMGGGAAPVPGPHVVPQMEMFSMRHDLTTGNVPVPDSSRTPSHRP